jgi:Lamin Tail Domain/Collagen triple helix repeat (20 copies)
MRSARGTALIGLGIVVGLLVGLTPAMGGGVHAVQRTLVSAHAFKKKPLRGPRGVRGPAGPRGATGPTGPTGATGTQGLQGAHGVAGAKGEKGDTGPSALAALDGTACTTHAGLPGKVAVTTAASDDVVLHCQPACTIKVNELQTGASGDATKEFVELYNPCSAPTDLSGWKLAYRPASNSGETTFLTMPGSTSIAAGGYLVMGTTSFSSKDLLMGGGMASTGGAVAIKNAADVRVDSVSYGTLSATNPFTEGAPAAAPTADQSISRLPNGTDTNDNSADFKVTVTPTPKAANS